jgi:cytochrome c oxidase cbb3-type subunit 2
MNHGFALFCGTFFAMICSWWVFIFGAQQQIGKMTPQPQPDENGPLYPVTMLGTVHQGLEVYRASGCAACHTRVVRSTDVPRWGKRITVAPDYLYEQPVLLGTQRIGPDLANVGARQRDATWHLLHLYDPSSVAPGSKMPAYKFLFEKRKMGHAPAAQALKLSGAAAPEAGFEIVPKPEALALLAFLLNQHFENDLFEAPLPASERAVKPAGTNAPAPGATNSPAK